jgi:hypothetical protein
MSAVAHRDSGIDPWSIDALLERYVSWREECIAVRESYRYWAGSRCGERRLAYGAYLAALDREEQAARSYADEIGRVRVILR